VRHRSCNNHARANNSAPALRSAVSSKTSPKLQRSLRQHTHNTHAKARTNTQENDRARATAVKHVPAVRRGQRGHAARRVRDVRAARSHHRIIICWHQLLQRK
jgi:hypothetical protein